MSHTLEVISTEHPVIPAAAESAHQNPNEEQITRVVFMIIMGAAVLFIAAILFVSHM